MSFNFASSPARVQTAKCIKPPQLSLRTSLFINVHRHYFQSISRNYFPYRLELANLCPILVMKAMTNDAHLSATERVDKESETCKQFRKIIAIMTTETCLACVSISFLLHSRQRLCETPDDDKWSLKCLIDLNFYFQSSVVRRRRSTTFANRWLFGHDLSQLVWPEKNE